MNMFQGKVKNIVQIKTAYTILVSKLVGGASVLQLMVSILISAVMLVKLVVSSHRGMVSTPRIEVRYRMDMKRISRLVLIDMETL